ncbi:MAG: hypothetical protein M1820_000918 [Bogoriella megaspora]|nr:MAG: hypothetical protein M1820_000918 [Bogoriella megaspora]
MPLTLVGPQYPNAKIDIIAVPDVGANPYATWRHPTSSAKTRSRNADSKFCSIYDAIKQARVYIYSYPPPSELFFRDRPHAIIDGFAGDLLAEVAAIRDSAGRPLHFAGHGSGGLVVRRSLLVSNASSNERLNSVSTRTFSVAFFGVPHHGSPFLSNELFEETVRDLKGINDLLNPPTGMVRILEDLATRGRRDPNDPTLSEKEKEALELQRTNDSWIFAEERLRLELSPEPSMYVDDIRRDFAHLARNLRRVWTFLESHKTILRVSETERKEDGSSDHEEVKEWSVWVVDSRSAILSNDEVYVGSEKVEYICTNHEHLCHFGQGRDAIDMAAFTKYTRELQSLSDELNPRQQYGLRYVEDELKTDILQFYRDQESTLPMTFTSVRPSLRELIEQGPSSCLAKALGQKSYKIVGPSKRPMQTPRQTATFTTNGHGHAFNISKAWKAGMSSTRSWPLGREKQASMGNSQITGSPTSRPMPITEGQELEVSEPPLRRLRRINTWTLPVREVVATPVNPLRRPSSELQNSNQTTVTDTTPNIPRTMSSPDSEVATPDTDDIASLSTALKHPGHLISAIATKPSGVPPMSWSSDSAAEESTSHTYSARPNPATSPEQQADQESRLPHPVHVQAATIPSTAMHMFRWIHVPCNSMLFVYNVMHAIGVDKQNPWILRNVLRPRSWSNKQHDGRHGLPHAKFMEPHAEHIDSLHGDDGGIVIYLPYLHWDTYGALSDRKTVIQECINPHQRTSSDTFSSSNRLPEHRLISQYLTSHSGFPLHHRRSLDQYRYPALTTFTVRDADQVLSKRNGSNRQMDAVGPRSLQQSNTAEEKELDVSDAEDQPKLMNSAHQYNGVPPRGKPDTGSSTTQYADRESKVLMVDQLWCWVVGNDTVFSSFTPRQNSHGEPRFFMADLRHAVLNDIQRDPRYACPCEDPLELLAIIIYHAITVLLDQTEQEDLQVFRIFEEYISELTERQTSSFRRFRHTNKNERKSKDEQRMKPDDDADDKQDLANYLEARDVEDELTSIKNLLHEQAHVIERLHSINRSAGGRVKGAADETREQRRKSRDKTSRILTMGLDKVYEYQDEIDAMLNDCKTLQNAYETLLDMRQKQASVDEAALARKSADVAADQNRAIVVFTIFTVLFVRCKYHPHYIFKTNLDKLPLSFFTSLFGMNVREWSGTPTNLPIDTIWVLMGSISAVAIVIALILAFFKPVWRFLRESVRGKVAYRVTNMVDRLGGPRRKFLKRNTGKRRSTEDDIIPYFDTPISSDVESGRSSLKSRTWRAKTNVD